MSELIFNNLYLAILLPLWIFLIIMCGRFFAVYVQKKIIYFLTVLSSFLGIIICSLNLFHYTKPIEQTINFIKVNDFTISLGLYTDKTALIIALTLFIISFFVQLFSISYMKDEKKNYRFYAFLNFFNFSMSGLIFSPNLFQFYIFWELIGVVSYLLIGFDYNSENKSNASKKVFLTNRIGDTALLSSIILISYFMYNYGNIKTLAELSFTNIGIITAILGAYASPAIFNLICIMFIIAAAIKSAQFPFYTWLQDAMEAKLPVSALLHSATLVAAGFYLLIRILPILQSEQFIMILLTSIGITTAIICSILASIETNPKKVLAYSTSANFGLMFWAVGLGQIVASILFFIAHAFTKSLLFLCVNNKSKADLILYVFGGLSICGILFAGISSKEILYAALNNKFIFCAISILTAFYITRLGLILYNQNLKEKINYIQLICEFGLIITNFCLYVIVRKFFDYNISLPFWFAATGIIFALILRKHLTIFYKTPRILEKIYYNFFPKLYESIANNLKCFDEKVLGNYKYTINASKFCVKTVNFIENNVMLESVLTITYIFKKISEQNFKLQKRNVQIYNAYAFIIVTIIITLLIIGYTLIINQLN